MAEIVAFILSGGCWIAGIALLVAAIWRKQIMRLSPAQVHVSRPLHLLAAILFFGIPFPLFLGKLPIFVIVAYALVAAAAAVYLCIADYRAKRPHNAG